MCRVGCLISKQGSIKLNFGVHDDDMCKVWLKAAAADRQAAAAAEGA